MEYELFDTGVFDEKRFSDVEIEHAKADVEDVLIRITCFNRGPDTASLVVLPSLVFRNTWSWPTPDGWNDRRSVLQRSGNDFTAEHETLGTFRFLPLSGPATVSPEAVLFTENESNSARACDGPGGGGQWLRTRFGAMSSKVTGVRSTRCPRHEGRFPVSPRDPLTPGEDDLHASCPCKGHAGCAIVDLSREC